MSRQLLDIDWENDPIAIRHPDEVILKDFHLYLKTIGIIRRSIVMPDRERGGFLLFLYEDCAPSAIESWILGDTEGVDAGG